MWTQGRLFDKHAKKRQKTRTMLNVWKKLIIGIFSEKHVFPQKVPLEALSPVLITLLTIFRQKSVFSTELKKLSPPPRPPFWKMLSNWTFFQENLFSWRSLSGLIKTPFWQSVFKFQKTSAECLEKVLKTLIQPKKDRLPKQNLQICRIHFRQSCWTFPKQYVILLLTFREAKCSISENGYPIAYNFPGKKSPWKKCFRQMKHIFDNRLKCCCQSTTKFCSSSDKISETIFCFKKIPQFFPLDTGTQFWKTCQKETKNKESLGKPRVLFW